MSSSGLPVEAGGAAPPPRSLLERFNGAVAVLGGLVTLAVALLVTASVGMRWFFSAPIDGDFEYVKMATAVAIFAYLPYTQARRGNIMVDTFTGWLPEGAQRALDAFWDLAYAALMGYVAYGLIHGTLEAFKSGETTMQRQLAVWPSIAVSMMLCILLSLTAVVTAVLMLRRRDRSGS